VEVNTGEVRNIIERVSVNQGKLCLGFRTNTPPGSKDYYKLLVYNSILGGGLHSKLFQNVREKAGLAYYAFSRLEKFKGLMVVSCGIEIKNKDKALEIIYNNWMRLKTAIFPITNMKRPSKHRNRNQVLKGHPASDCGFLSQPVYSGNRRHSR